MIGLDKYDWAEKYPYLQVMIYVAFTWMVSLTILAIYLVYKAHQIDGGACYGL